VGMEEVADRFVGACVEMVNEASLGSGLGSRIEKVYKIEERDVLHVD